MFAIATSMGIMQSTLTIGGRITVRLVSSLTGLDSTNRVKLETCRTVIHPPIASDLWCREDVIGYAESCCLLFTNIEDKKKTLILRYFIGVITFFSFGHLYLSSVHIMAYCAA